MTSLRRSPRRCARCCRSKVYLLERLPNPAAAETLGLLVGHLERTAEASDAGLTWLTLPDWLPPWQRDAMPDGCYNLGVAHGVPGVLGFLAAAQRTGFQDPRIARLADGLASWIFAQRLGGDESRYPAAMVPGKRSDPTRSAWCYGDPGIAAVLLSAARAFNRPDWEEEALIVARLSRPPGRAERRRPSTLPSATARSASPISSTVSIRLPGIWFSRRRR